QQVEILPPGDQDRVGPAIPAAVTGALSRPMHAKAGRVAGNLAFDDQTATKTMKRGQVENTVRLVPATHHEAAALVGIDRRRWLERDHIPDLWRAADVRPDGVARNAGGHHRHNNRYRRQERGERLAIRRAHPLSP